MQGASRASLSMLREHLPTDGDLIGLSEQLYAVVSLLLTQGSLRRALSDPASPAVTKAGLVDRLFGAQLDGPTLDLLREAARSRWSQPRDLVDSLEELAVEAALAAAESVGQLEEVEDELFRFSRILDAEPTLRAVLTERNISRASKRGLLHTLLEGRVTSFTFSLISRAAIEPRGRPIEHVLLHYSTLAAQRRDRLIAHVRTAVELTDDEQRELATALSASYQHEMRLEVVVDEALIGGLTVRVGDEMIDASVARQLAEARRKLTGGSGARPRRG